MFEGGEQVLERLNEEDVKLSESAQKRRGRPEKKSESFFSEGEELFTIHDNIFHVAVLFYTFKVFDKAPTRKKFNPTIGFSVYEKVKNLDKELKRYYNNDQIAVEASEAYKDNPKIVQFFKNCLTFGPKCIVDEFYLIFHFVLTKIREGQEVSVELCLQFIVAFRLKYINFNNQVMDFFEAKTPMIVENLREVIQTELEKLLEILIHTLECLSSEKKENKFAYILESEENMFERGVGNRSKKRVKKE